MIEKFNLKIGENKIIKRGNIEYRVSCSIFKDHDHKNKPLYLYNDKIKEDDIVATVEGNDSPPYPSPYSSEVKESWGVFRKNVIISFVKKNNGLLVAIEDTPGSAKLSF